LAYKYVDEIGELGYIINLTANNVGRAGLSPERLMEVDEVGNEFDPFDKETERVNAESVGCLRSCVPLRSGC